MRTFEVRVTHKLGFFSFYDIDANNSTEAAEIAKQNFKRDFCNSDTSLSEMQTYIFDKYQLSKVCQIDNGIF